MAKRQRLEDLGRIAAIVDEMCKNELFDWNERYRNKDTAEWFQTLSKEKQFDKIHSLAYSISHIHDQLHEVWNIARWGDDEDELQHNHYYTENNCHYSGSSDRNLWSLFRIWWRSIQSSIRYAFKRGTSRKRC